MGALKAFAKPPLYIFQAMKSTATSNSSTPAPNWPVSRAVQIGAWCFDPASGQLWRGSQGTRLQPLQARLLAVLAANPARVLTREWLVDHLWHDRIVNEEALSRAVAELRKHLGDAVRNPEYIETVPKQGYRLKAPVTDVRQRNRRRLLWCGIAVSISALVLWGMLWLRAHLQLNRMQQAVDSAVRLTAAEGMEEMPEISPQGDRLAFVRAQDGLLQVEVQPLVGSTRQTLRMEDANVLSPVFSPDGESLAVAVIAQQPPHGCTVMVVDLSTHRRRLVGPCDLDDTLPSLDWSADGRELAFTRASSMHAGSAIWRVDLHTGEARQVSWPPSADVFDARPRFSPNGSQLSFTRGNRISRNLMLIRLDAPDSAAQELTRSGHYMSSQDWLDESHIVYDSDVNGQRHLWLMNASNGRSQLLGARDAQLPSITADGRRMTFQVAHYQANIWSLDLHQNGAEPVQLIDSTKYDNNPAFAPDGQSLLFASNRHGNGAVWLHDFASGVDARLFELPEVKLSRPAWSPDGAAMLVTGNGGPDGFFTVLYRFENAQHERVDFQGLPTRGAVFGADNDTVYAVSESADGVGKIVRKDLRSGGVTVLSHNGANRLMTVASHTLVFSKTNTPGLFLMDAHSGHETALDVAMPASAFNFWTVSEPWVYFVGTGALPATAENAKSGIWRVHLYDQSVQFISTHRPNTVGPSLAVDADNRRLVYSRTDRAESDVFIANLLGR